MALPCSMVAQLQHFLGTQACVMVLAPVQHQHVRHSPLEIISMRLHGCYGMSRAKSAHQCLQSCQTLHPSSKSPVHTLLPQLALRCLLSVQRSL